MSSLCPPAHPDNFAAHGQVPLGEGAERMTVPVSLMREHPRLELVFSGGEGRLLTTGVTEAELAKLFYQQQGLEGDTTELTEYSLTHSLLRWQTALHEWLGILVYGVTR